MPKKNLEKEVEKSFKSKTKENILKKTKQKEDIFLKKIFKNVAKTKEKTLEEDLKKIKKQKEIKEAINLILKYLPKIKDIADFKYDKQAIATSSGYGAPPKESSVDYEKLFSYLGKYKTKGMYDDFAPFFFEGQKEETKPAELAVTNKKIDMVVQHFKYFIQGMLLTDPALPPPGVSSEEYEKVKFWRKTNPAEYQLRFQIS